MAFKKIQKFVSSLTAIIFAISIINAAASFTITPTQVTKTLDIGDSDNIQYTIENTGDETLNLTISKTDLDRSGNTMGISLSQTEILNLTQSQTVTFNATYSTSGQSAGNYLGSVSVTNQANSSQKEVSNLDITLNTITGARLEITDFDNDVIKLSGELDEKETKSFRIKNIGTVDLNNLKFKFYDLEGNQEGDEIENDELDTDEDNFDLKIGSSERVELEVDIPDDIEIDTYVGKAIVSTTEGYEFEFRVEVDVEGGDLEIEFENVRSISDNEMYVIGEAGETVDDYEFQIENSGNINARNLQFVVDGDLEEETTSRELDASIISFDKSTIDLENGDDEVIEVEFDIPENTLAGTYVGEIQVRDSENKELDSFRVKLKVVGDVYIKEIKFEEKVSLDSRLDVEVTVANQGKTLERGIKVNGRILSIDKGNSDVTESSSTFILDSGDERTQTLKFDIPDDAEDGTHTLEIEVTYGDGTLREIEEIEVTRPAHNIEFKTFGVGKNLIKCDTDLLVFNKVENLGEEDEFVTFETEIVGTGIKKKFSEIEVEVDESVQQNFNLDVSSLEAGTYEVTSKVSYSGFFKKEKDTITVRDCNSASTGLDIEETNETKVINDPTDGVYELFGQQLDQTQVYLIIGISVVFVLIIVSLFFI